MATYNDTRNWDQEELDRARELARENVASDGASVPQASRLNNAKADREEGKAEPSPVLEGERPTTEEEREAVANGVTVNSEDVEADKEAGKANFEQNSPKAKSSRKSQ